MGISSGFAAFSAAGDPDGNRTYCPQAAHALDTDKFIQPSSARCDGHRKMVDSGPRLPVGHDELEQLTGTTSSCARSRSCSQAVRYTSGIGAIPNWP